MALNQIPVLPESYPLFDWADYQSSRDALVKGTPTVQFARAAWNAIVDDLSDALAEAGQEWDETYTTADGAQMTDTDGQLTAAKFNSVRLNIDHPAPLGWAWERKPDFRGYLGRAEVRGVSTHGRRCDTVYPEYIIELARKLNLLIEVMRETALLVDIECGMLLGVTQEIELRSQPAARIEVGHTSATQVQPDIVCQPAAHIETNTGSFTSTSTEADAKQSVPLETSVSIPLLIEVEGDPGPVAPMEAEPYLAKSKVSVLLESIPISRVVRTGAEVQMQSAVSADAIGGESVSTDSDVMLASAVSVDVTSAKPVYVAVDEISNVSVSADVDNKTRARPIQAALFSETKIETAATIILPVQIDAHAPTKTLVSCRLDSAWYPPKWINGGLWIRQSHNVTQNEKGELVIK